MRVVSVIATDYLWTTLSGDLGYTNFALLPQPLPAYGPMGAQLDEKTIFAVNRDTLAGALSNAIFSVSTDVRITTVVLLPRTLFKISHFKDKPLKAIPV